MKFDEKGDGPARYTILNYQKNPETNGYDYKVSPMLVPSAQISAANRSIGSTTGCTITEKAPTRDIVS